MTDSERLSRVRELITQGPTDDELTGWIEQGMQRGDGGQAMLGVLVRNVRGVLAVAD